MSEETPCKYCGHWPDPADDFAYVAVCNGQTFCAEPVCKGKCYQCRIATQQARLDRLRAASEQVLGAWGRGDMADLDEAMDALTVVLASPVLKED